MEISESKLASIVAEAVINALKSVKDEKANVKEEVKFGASGRLVMDNVSIYDVECKLQECAIRSGAVVMKDALKHKFGTSDIYEIPISRYAEVVEALELGAGYCENMDMVLSDDEEEACDE